MQSIIEAKCEIFEFSPFIYEDHLHLWSQFVVRSPKLFLNLFLHNTSSNIMCVCAPTCTQEEGEGGREIYLQPFEWLNDEAAQFFSTETLASYFNVNVKLP